MVESPCNSRGRYIDAIRVQRAPGAFDSPTGDFKFRSVAVYGVEHFNSRGMTADHNSPVFVSGTVAPLSTDPIPGRTDSWASCKMYESEGLLGTLEEGTDAAAVGDNCCTDTPASFTRHEDLDCDANLASGSVTHLGTHSNVNSAGACAHICLDRTGGQTPCNAFVFTQNPSPAQVSSGPCQTKHLSAHALNNVDSVCTIQVGVDTYVYDGGNNTRGCESGSNETDRPYFEGHLQYRTQISKVRVFPRLHDGDTSLGAHKIWYRLAPNQSPWTRYKGTRCLPDSALYLSDRKRAVSSEVHPVTVNSVHECMLLIETHSLIDNAKPDMIAHCSEDLCGGVNNCIVQKMRSEQNFPKFDLNDCYGPSDYPRHIGEHWDTYVYDHNFPEDLERFPPSPPPPPPSPGVVAYDHNTGDRFTHIESSPCESQAYGSVASKAD